PCSCGRDFWLEVFRISGLVALANHLFAEAAQLRTQDSCRLGLDARSLFSPRYCLPTPLTCCPRSGHYRCRTRRRSLFDYECRLRRSGSNGTVAHFSPGNLAEPKLSATLVEPSGIFTSAAVCGPLPGERRPLDRGASSCS